MSITPVALPVPVSPGPGAWVPVSHLKEFRTIQFNGAAGVDEVMIEQSANGSSAAPLYALKGTGIAKSENNNAAFLRANRTAGSGAATCFVEAQPATAAGTIQFKEVTITHADLTAAAPAQDVNLGAVLPVDAMILGFDLNGFTPFSGGGATAVAATMGSAADKDAVIGAVDLFAAALDGGPSTVIAFGIRPFKQFVTATQLLARFSSDVDVADLTAGSVTFVIAYFVPA